MISSCKTAVKGYIEQYAQGVKGSKILDIGCGDGEYTSLFCHDKNEVVGLDLKNTVKREFKKFKFVKGDAECLPFPNGSFDLVISFDVLEHIYDDKRAIREVYRVLRKNGKIFLETPNRERLSYWLLVLAGKRRNYPLKLGEDCIHLREYVKQELEEIFRERRFKKIKTLPFWIGLRGGRFDLGIIRPPRFLEGLCQCWFVEAGK